MKLWVLLFGHGVYIRDDNIATRFKLTMKVFNRDDNIVNLYRLEMKDLGEHEGVTRRKGHEKYLPITNPNSKFVISITYILAIKHC
jgi:hypothetical protein